MNVLELDANGFGFNEKVDFLADLHGKIDVRAFDRELGGNFDVFLIPQHVGQHVADDDDGIRFADIALPGAGQYRTVSLQPVADPVQRLLADWHRIPPNAA
jgi:hypothetical protein